MEGNKRNRPRIESAGCAAVPSSLKNKGAVRPQQFRIPSGRVTHVALVHHAVPRRAQLIALQPCVRTQRLRQVLSVQSW